MTPVHSQVQWSDVDLRDEIGGGSYGKVHIAKWRETTVAVKVLGGGVIPEDKTFRPAHLGGTVDDWRGHPRFWDHMQEVGRCERFVERKTLRALGVDRLEFKPAAERQEIAPKRELIQREMLEAEKKRLEESKAKNVAGYGASPVPITVA